MRDDGIFDVANRLLGISIGVSIGAEEPFAANDVLHARRFHRFGADVEIRSFDGHDQSIERNIVESKVCPGRLRFGTVVHNRRSKPLH